MNKILEPQTSLIEKKVMQKIHNDRPRIQSRWHYLSLSALSVITAVLFIFITAYFISIATLWLRIRTAEGPAYGAKLNLIALTSSFPWWALVLGVISLASVVYFIKRTGQMYKIRLILLVPLVVTIVMAIGFIFSYSTLPVRFSHHRSNMICVNSDANCDSLRQGYMHRQ